MRVAHKTRAWATVVTIAVTLGAVGCGEDEPVGSGGGGGGEAGIDVAGAQAFVDEHSAPPEGLGLTVPLSEKPPTGIYLITLETPQPVSVQKNDAIAEAAELLGWKYERIQMGTDAEGAPRAFKEALERNPDIVHYSGTPAAAVQQQLEAAEAQGVLAISDSNTDEVQPPLISTSLDSTEQVEAWGEMSAATVVATSGEPTSVALVTIEAYPSLVAYTEKFIETMEKYCSACEVEVVNQQISDLGQTTPGAVVSAVQRNPDIGWVIFSFGDLALGVPAALRGANLQEQVKVGGETPSEANLEALRKGDEAFWTAFPTSILGWRVVDMVARHFVGDDLTPANEALLPTQILTPDNIDDALFEDGIYVGVEDYQSEFKKLWLIE